MLGCHREAPASAPLPADEALATLAHELRDPLVTILMALDLHSGDGEPAARRALTMAAQQARRAVRLVDDLFDLCAGPRGSLRLRKELVDQAAIVAGATEATAHLLAARGHRMTVSLPAEPVFLAADPLRLEQVLTNLVAVAEWGKLRRAKLQAGLTQALLQRGMSAHEILQTLAASQDFDSKPGQSAHVSRSAG
jgi:K+-sensing histidine kinase KdpD